MLDVVEHLRIKFQKLKVPIIKNWYVLLYNKLSDFWLVANLKVVPRLHCTVQVMDFFKPDSETADSLKCTPKQNKKGVVLGAPWGLPGPVTVKYRW